MMRAHLRKRPREDTPPPPPEQPEGGNENNQKEGEGEDEDQRLRSHIAETLKRQKRRAWKAVAPELLKHAPQEKREMQQQQQEEKFGLKEKQTLQEFSAGTDLSLNPYSTIEHEDKMKEYIERKLAERHGMQDEEQEEVDQSKPKFLSLDHQAMEIPAHLQQRRASEPLEDANRWLTGIQEIQLPLEYKIRNVEVTEQARQRAMLRATSNNPLHSKAPANFNSNFLHHKRFMSALAKGAHVEPQFELQFDSNNIPAEQEQAKFNDDEYLERFRATKIRGRF